MVKLGGAHLQFRNFPEDAEAFVLAISDNPNLAMPLRSTRAFLASDEVLPEGFRVYLGFEENESVLNSLTPGTQAVLLPEDYRYLGDGDVVRLVPRLGGIRTLFRKNSHHNWFLTTERCNNFCLMCSQPPKPFDDSWIVNEILETLPLIDQNTPEIGYSGGEPTLLGDDFFRILNATKSWLPRTAVHILSNGRAFSDLSFARKYADVDHPDMMVGIPLYSDVSHLHDYVVQADGAFDETIRGILNLKRLGQRVEVRVVIHAQTYERLPQLAEFLSRNLLFIDHVALMGLEMTGFTKANLSELWIDPLDYQPQLRDAVHHLARRGMNVSIYNHQMCLLDPSLWPFARKSISDWKNIYMPECEGCTKKTECGGFFASATLRYSDHIRPFNLAEGAVN